MRTGRRRRCRRRAGSRRRTRRRSGGRATVGAAGRAGGSPSVTAAARGTTGTVSTRARRSATRPPGGVDRLARRRRVAAVASATPRARDRQRGRPRTPGRAGRAPRARDRRRASRRRVWRRWQPGRLRSWAGRSSDAHTRSAGAGPCPLAAATSSRVRANLSRDGRLVPSGLGLADGRRFCDGWTDLEVSLLEFEHWTRIRDDNRSLSGRRIWPTIRSQRRSS